MPVVMTLHNYRLMCPSGLMMRNDSTCDDCIRGSPYRAALHRCYRSSIMGSLSAARTVAVHRRRGTWRTEVSQFIALTEFGRRLFVAGGLPASRLRVKPNFCSDPGQRQSSRQRVALFAGRLSTEKGIGTLLKAWESVDGRLRIAGEGSIGMEPKERVRGLGLLAAEDLGREMGRAQFLVMPSEWFEGFPMAIVEAFAHGLPVLCSRLGAMAEIVQDHRTGLYFEAGNHEDLARKANWLLRHPEECARMGGQARLEYESKYTPEKNYGMLMEIYGTAVEGARN